VTHVFAASRALSARRRSSPLKSRRWRRDETQERIDNDEVFRLKIMTVIMQPIEKSAGKDFVTLAAIEAMR
jgi:hypothetical protein